MNKENDNTLLFLAIFIIGVLVIGWWTGSFIKLLIEDNNNDETFDFNNGENPTLFGLSIENCDLDMDILTVEINKTGYVRRISTKELCDYVEGAKIR